MVFLFFFGLSEVETSPKAYQCLRSASAAIMIRRKVEMSVNVYRMPDYLRIPASSLTHHGSLECHECCHPDGKVTGMIMAYYAVHRIGGEGWLWLGIMQRKIKKTPAVVGRR